MTTHPETVTLPHTGLQVPASHPQVVSMSSLPTPNGTKLIALVRFDGHDIGAIEGTAGGALWFRPTGPAFSPARLDAFAAQCRHHGQQKQQAGHNRRGNGRYGIRRRIECRRVHVRHHDRIHA